MGTCVVCDRRDAHHRCACSHCVHVTQRELRQLDTYLTLLDGWFTRPAIRPSGVPHRGGFVSTPPVDITVVAMLDRRSRINGDGSDDEEHAVWSLPGQLEHLAVWLADACEENLPARANTRTHLVYILSKVDYAAGYAWTADLARIVHTLWVQARRHSHDQPPSPLGRCISDGCGGSVHRVVGTGVTCDICHRVYTGLDLVQLGLNQAHA